jgi:hypothetical protein
MTLPLQVQLGLFLKVTRSAKMAGKCRLKLFKYGIIFDENGKSIAQICYCYHGFLLVCYNSLLVKKFLTVNMTKNSIRKAHGEMKHHAQNNKFGSIG